MTGRMLGRMPGRTTGPTTGPTTGGTRLRLASGSVVAALLLLSGCGQDPSPADQVPALSRALTRVDEAVASEEYDTARDSIDRLVATTVQARDDGDLEADQADTILAAADRLRSALPGETTEPSETGTEPVPEETDAPEETSPTPAPEPSPEVEPEKPEKPEDKNDNKGKGGDKGKGN